MSVSRPSWLPLKDIQPPTNGSDPDQLAKDIEKSTAEARRLLRIPTPKSPRHFPLPEIPKKKH
jgi:hypothetical protein